jgi:exonuclease III
MKIVTYNVNGIRAALKKDWLGWLKAENPDVVCLQEIKATLDQVPEAYLLEQMGYEHYWYPAQKRVIAELRFSREKVLSMWNMAADTRIMTSKGVPFEQILTTCR